MIRGDCGQTGMQHRAVGTIFTMNVGAVFAITVGRLIEFRRNQFYVELRLRDTIRSNFKGETIE